MEQSGFNLVDSGKPKPEKTGPTLAQKSAKVAGRIARAVGNGTVKLLGSGTFWLLGICGGGIYGIGSMTREEAREQSAFEQRITEKLEQQGFTVVASDSYSATDNRHNPSKRLKFPADFEYGAILTATRNGRIYDVGAVNREISRSGYQMDMIIGYKDITPIKVPAFNKAAAKPAVKPVVKPVAKPAATTKPAAVQKQVTPQKKPG